MILRITRLQASFNPDFRRFAAVKVDPATQLATSTRDRYYIKVETTKIALEPSRGQFLRVRGQGEVKEVMQGDNNYLVNEHRIEDDVEVEFVDAVTNHAFIEFIASDKGFAGIGTAIATDIWNTFKQSIFSVLKSDDAKEQLTKPLKSVRKDNSLRQLTERQIDSLIEGFERYKNLQYAEFFTKMRIPLHVQKRIFKFKSFEELTHLKTSRGTSYSLNVAQIIQENPFLLMNFGMSFEQVDDIAQDKFNVSKDNENRLSAAVHCMLLEAQNKGDTLVLSSSEHIKELKKLVGSELANKALNIHSSKTFVKFDDCYQSTSNYIAERVIAKRFLKLNAKSKTFENTEVEATRYAMSQLPFELLDKQKEAVFTAVESSISVISGGAGTGKTTILKVVVETYKKLGYYIHAMALSGRAASRLKESIDMPTSTIAKFLKSKKIINDNTKSLIIIDEASMLDVMTMYRIVTHVTPNVRILLVGDMYQLPAIGAGQVLEDVINSKVIAVVELDVAKRACGSTGIAEYSVAIRNNEIPEKLSTGAIVFHDTAYDDVKTVCTKLYADSNKSARIVAFSNKLVEHINTLCQQTFNANAEKIQIEHDQQNWQVALYKHDPVLFTKNNYDLDIQNGSLGELISLPGEEDDSEFALVELDDDKRAIELTFNIMLDVLPAYAMTLHKAQGSQFDDVIVALSASERIDYRWLYTAVTRAQKILHIVGPEEKFFKIIKHKSTTTTHRTTALSYYLSNSDFKLVRKERVA